MKEASEMKYGDQVEGVCNILNVLFLLSAVYTHGANICTVTVFLGQTWDDIIRVMTSATVRFELLSTVHTSPVSVLACGCM